ncbi:MAG: GNAT family N-acetyltransferase [Cyanobacteria bacterium]|nr:GNAT family N-acetyltransferase [Cyanobacteriota bacterium]
MVESRLFEYSEFVVRSWQSGDRVSAAAVIETVLAEYGLGWEPEGADADVLKVEECYRDGEFWVVELNGGVVGTAAYYPIDRAENAVEIRKMYLLPIARGKGLGRFLLNALEAVMIQKGFAEIWIETASVLREAVILYERSGYEAATGVETERCDRVYVKKLSVLCP